MSSPIDRLLGRLLPQSRFRGDRRPVSVFTPRRFNSRLRPLTGTQLTLVAPESLETRQLWAVVPYWDSSNGVLHINLTAAGDSAFVRVTTQNVQVSSSISGPWSTTPSNTSSPAGFPVTGISEVRVRDTSNSLGQSFTLLQVLPLNAFLNIPSPVGTNGTIESVVLNGSVRNRADIFAGNIQLDSAIDASAASNRTVSLTLASGTLNVTAAVTGNDVTMAAPGGVSIQSPVNGTTFLTLTAASGITGAANISGGNVVLSAPGGNIGISGIVTATGSFAATAPAGTISLQGSATSASGLTLLARDAIQTAGGLTVTAGDLAVTSTTNAITATGFLSANGVGRTVAITAATNINTTAAVTANSTIAYTATTGSIATSGPITSSNGLVSLQAHTAINTTAAVTANSTINYHAVTGGIALSGPITSSNSAVLFLAETAIDTTAAVTARNNVAYRTNSPLGDISVLGGITSTSGSVSLLPSNGRIEIDSGISATAGSVDISAYNDIELTTLGSITGFNVSIESFGSSGPSTSNITLSGNVTANALGGSLLILGPDSAPGRLNATGTLAAENLVVFSLSDAAPLNLVTNANRISGQTSNDLTITNSRDLTIGTGVLAAGGNLDVRAAGNILVTANLSAPVNKSLSINATSGSVTLNASVSSVNAPVSIAASNRINGTAAITVASGSNSNLSLRAGNGITATTQVDSLTAQVTGTGDISIAEVDGLTLLGDVTTNSGSISLNTGTNTSFAGNLDGSGLITAGGPTGNITLRSGNGSVLLNAVNNQVSGTGFLNITARNNIAVNSAVGSLAATASTAGATITVNEADGLGIGGNVTTTNGNISITAGRFAAGDVTGSGQISAGTRNVTLTNANGGVQLSGVTGQIAAANLTVTARDTVSVNTNVTNASVTVTGPLQPATIQQTRQLSGLSVVTNAGDITVNLASGNLLSASSVTASNGTATGNVTLGAVAGSIGVGTITANILTLQARNSSSFNTNIATLNANITGAGQTFALTETNGLSIGATGVRTTNGQISITAGNAVNGTLNGPGAINAGTGNVLLTNTRGAITTSGLVTGSVLTATAQNDISLATNIATLSATVAGTGNITVAETNGLSINGNGVSTAIGNGSIRITAGSAVTGDLGVNANVTAGAGNVTLVNTRGRITTSGSNTIIGNVLDVTAQNAVSIRSNVVALTANVTGIGDLSVFEESGLQIAAAGVTTATGAIDILAGQVADGTLNGNGFVNAGAANVTLRNNRGAITTSGLISGNVLNVGARNDVSLNTSVSGLTANLTNAGNLVISERNGLSIEPGGVRTGNGNVSITAGGGVSGTLDGSGVINAVSRNVTLTNANGSIALTGVNQVIGNVVSIQGRDNVVANTSATTLNASAGVIGSGNATATLTVNESTGLGIAGAATTGGAIAITSGLYGPSTLTGTGAINATTGNVTLTNANGGISLTAINQVTGNVLAIAARDFVNVNTSVSSIDATAGVIGGTNPAATLTVNESTGLNIVGATTVAGAISITSGLYGASTLTGTGSINAVTGNVALTNANGGIVLTGANQITGNVLSVVAQNDVALNAAVVGLEANLTGAGGLAIVNSRNLAIAATTSVVTTSGAVAISAPNLALDGSLTAGGPSNVTLSVAGQITGSGSLLASNLVWSAAAQPNDTNWTYDSLDATVTGLGNAIAITRSSSTNLRVLRLSTASAPISLAMTGLAGDLTLAGPVTAGGTENVTFNVTNGGIGGSGLVTGNVLNIASVGSSSLVTNVASLAANVSGPLAGLTVVEQNGLGVVAGDDVTATDAISITVTNGDFDLSGNLTSLTAGNVTLSVPNGSITGTGNLAAGNLSWVALSQNDTVSQNWIYSGITANVTGAGNNLTISSNGALTIFGLYTHSGEISITPADMTVATNVDLQGDVIAGLNQVGYNDVLINLNGAINSNGGTIIGDALSLNVASESSLATNVASLSATMTGTGSLWISEADNLTIAAPGISNPSGDVNLLSPGDIRGPGQIVAINLDIGANSAVLNTNVSALTASITGAGGVGLNVTQSGPLSIGINGVLATAGAPISLNVSGGLLNGSGTVDAGSGDVRLTVAGGGIDLSDVRGANLTIRSANSVVLATQVGNLTASVTDASASFTVTDLDDLTILPAGVTTAHGDINLLSQTGAINGTGVLNAGAANLTLNAVTEIDLDAVANQVVGNFLNVATTFGSINVATNISRVSAAAINGSVVITDIGDLAVTPDDKILAAPTGNITINLDGNLSIAGNVTGDGGGFVLLNSAGGHITTSGSNTFVFAESLDIRAATSSTLNTSVNRLTALISGPGANLAVTNRYEDGSSAATGANLSIGAGNVVLNGGTFSLTLATNTDASLGGTGSINAGSGNVVISAANGGVTLSAVNNQIVGNVLTIAAQNAIAVNTSVQTLAASVTNSAATLTVNEGSGLAIANATTAGGAIAITSGRFAASTLTGTGLINATTAGNVTLTNANGGIVLTGLNQVTASVATISARDSVSVNTSVTALNASAGVIGGGNATASLTVNESTGLMVVAATTTGGAIGITSGLYGASHLTGAGTITASTAGDVSLRNANGSITFTGMNQIVGNQAVLAARDSVAVNTSVASLDATAGLIGGGNSSAMLTVNEADGLAVSNAVTSGGLITITGGLAGVGNITGSGVVNATSAGNVVLTNANGGITLTATAGQITANVLNVAARTSTALNTDIRTLVANISGEGSSLTVNEVNGLFVTGNLATANGAIAVAVAAGNLTVSGLVNAGVNGNVTLDVAGALNVSGQVSGNVLSVNASNTTALNTSVTELNANITGSGANLTVTEANNLTIGTAGVRTSNSPIVITTLGGGSLVRTGGISAGTANVALTLAGGTSGTGLVTADRLTLQAATAVSVNTTVNSVIANVSGSGQPLAIFQESRDLVVPTGTVRTNNGSLTLSVTGGNLTALGNVAAGNAAVTLTASGAVNASTGLISGNALTVVANSTSALNTSVGSLVANITGAGSSLTVTEADSLTIESGDVRTNGGNIAITTAGGGSLLRTGTINAGGGNVALSLGGGTSGSGLVTADRLTLLAATSSSVNTTVNSVLANVTGIGQPLTVVQAGSDLVVPTGTIRTNNGNLTLSVTGGNLTALGNVTAGTAAVTLSATGAVNASTGQISGNALTVVANSTSALNTAVASIVANITGSGSTLTVTEADNLTIGAGDVRTNNGVVSITTSGGGALARTGNIAAGSANVTLNVAGGTSGTGLISGNELNLTAAGASTISSALASLVANLSAGTLTVSDVDGLSIGAGGVRTNNAAIAITTAGGSLSGPGVVNAGTANVSLTNTNGGINLTAVSEQVVAGGLTVTSTTTSLLNTNVSTLTATVSGASQGLVVNQNSHLQIAGVSLSNGTVQLNAAGGLTGSGPVSAGSAGFVVLNASAGAVTLTAANQVTASGLTLTAQNSSAVNTSIDTLTANISGSGQTLTVNEANGLQVAAGNVAGRGDITLNLAAGSLTGVGVINANGGAANVVLNAFGGALNPSGTITANTLTARAANTSSLTTNVTTLNANITGAGQGLAVTEVNALSIGTGNILTNNGDLAINVTSGGINGTGRIATGTGNISLRTPAGGVTLNSSASQVSGNALTVVAQGSTAINTSITSLNANVTGAGSLTINEANNIAVTQARTANGAITLTTSANSTINVTSINAATGTFGNLTVVNGNLFIDNPGIVASNTVNLSQAQSVTILSGDILAPNVILPSGQNTVLYSVTSANDAGPGSLRDVITRINSRGGTFNSTIVVSTPTTVPLNSALPAMTVQMNVQGNNLLTLNGTSAGTSSSGFTITSTSAVRSTISGVTFQNFGAAGVDLVGARNISVTGITVTGSTIGFRASGNLAGTGVYGSTFTNNVIGATLASAQNLLVGIVPVTNVLFGNSFTGGTGFRGASTTGMSITGASTGTIIKANTINNYPTAVSIVAATNLTVGGTAAGEGNAISNASTAGIYATGFCTGSSVIKTTFPTGVVSTKQYVVATSRNLNIIR